MDACARFLVERSRSTYGPARLIGAVALGSSIELAFLPFALIRLGQAIDAALGIGRPLGRDASLALAGACFALGVPWLASSIWWQHWKGRGTPLPLVPTKELLTDGPYRYSRNPMALGAVLWLSGWASFADSATALFGGVGLFAAVVLSWDRCVEERELALKHGAAYEEYRRKTPFLLPKLR